jgi:hypothetical protein
MDNFTLDDILNRRNEENRSDEILKIEIPKYMETYPVLKKYDHIEAKDFKNQLKLRYIIRYSKNLTDQPSPGCFIQKINYKIDKSIHSLLLTTVMHHNKIWAIDPVNYFIFKYSPVNNERQKEELKVIIVKNHQNTLEDCVDKFMSGKKVRAQLSKKERLLDEKINNIVSKNEIDKKKEKVYQKKNLSQRQELSHEDNAAFVDAYIKEFEEEQKNLKGSNTTDKKKIRFVNID